ncbi:MAG: exodeoxyribonuclease III [Bacteroidales bacterium]|nr:exodeoxyribonuclease III [Candidatus Scybalousia scybalohippi]
MKIYSYNVNGIRAAMGKGFMQWLEESNADVVCIQETKAQPDQVPSLEFLSAGYFCQCFSAEKKGYSGVAILSKKEPKNIQMGMGIEKYDREGRMIRFDYDDVSIVSVYHPSGTSGEERQNFKMQWLEDFQSYAVELQKQIPNIIFCGDYNICHEAIDIHDPKGNAKNSGFLPEEREWMTRFLDAGFTDSFRFLHPEEKDAYSWWSYRANARAKNKGWRIDYCMTSNIMKDRIIGAGINPNAMQSDHCPIYVEIK